jgi:hypothetical protein
MNFFVNVICLNLAGNKIDIKGAYDLSLIMVDSRVQWVELILSDNMIKTKGFIAIVYALVRTRSTNDSAKTARSFVSR